MSQPFIIPAGTYLDSLGVLFPAVPRCSPGKTNSRAFHFALKELVPELVRPWEVRCASGTLSGKSLTVGKKRTQVLHKGKILELHFPSLGLSCRVQVWAPRRLFFLWYDNRTDDSFFQLISAAPGLCWAGQTIQCRLRLRSDIAIRVITYVKMGGQLQYWHRPINRAITAGPYPW